MPSPLTGVNAECLLLSASKRTLDACVTEVSSGVPDFVKAALATSETLVPRRHDVFRDSLVTFLSFQDVYWHYPSSYSRDLSSNPVPQHNSGTLSLATAHSENLSFAPKHSPLPGNSQFLVLGFANGVQVWALCPPDTGAWWSKKPCNLTNVSHPPAKLATSFRTPRAVDIVQLLDDVPPRMNAQKAKQYRRVAVVSALSARYSPSCSQHPASAEASFTVEIYTTDKEEALPAVSTTSLSSFHKQHNSSFHVLRQPWPIVELASSLCWANDAWLTTLVVATTAQIRVYDSIEFAIRFTISNFLAVAIPPVWDWLAARQGRSTKAPPAQFFFRDSGLEPNAKTPIVTSPPADLHDAAAVQNASSILSAPVFALGTRWLVYQEAISARSSRTNVLPTGATAEGENCRREGWSARLQQMWSQTLGNTAAFRRFRDTHASSTFTAMLNAIPPLPRPTELLRRATPCVVQDLSTPLSSLMSSRHVGTLQQQLTGGRLVVIDVATGKEVGTVWGVTRSVTNVYPKQSQPSNVLVKDLQPPNRVVAETKEHDTKLVGLYGNRFTVTEGQTRRDQCARTPASVLFGAKQHPETTCSLTSEPQVGEATDGPWCLSYLIGKTSCDHSDKLSTPSPPAPLNLQEAPPAMAFMRFDATMTTLFCADWTGRTVWVCRLFSTPSLAVDSQRESQTVQGHPVLALQRGKTVGTIVDISSSRNLCGGEICVTVTTSRGSCHCFGLPTGFHLAQLQRSDGQTAVSRNAHSLSPYNLPLLFPASLRAAFPPRLGNHRSSATPSEQNNEAVGFHKETLNNGWDSLPCVAELPSHDSQRSAAPVYCVLNKESDTDAKACANLASSIDDAPVTMQLTCTQQPRQVEECPTFCARLPRLYPFSRVALFCPSHSSSSTRQESIDDEPDYGGRSLWRVAFLSAPFLPVHGSARRRRRPLLFLPFLTAAADGVLEFLGVTYSRKQLRKRVFLHPTSALDSLLCDPKESSASPNALFSVAKQAGTSIKPSTVRELNRKSTDSVNDSERANRSVIEKSLLVTGLGAQHLIRLFRSGHITGSDVPSSYWNSRATLSAINGNYSLPMSTRAYDIMSFLGPQFLPLEPLECSGTFYALTLSTRELDRWARADAVLMNEIQATHSEENNFKASSASNANVNWARFCEPLTSVPLSIAYNHVCFPYKGRLQKCDCDISSPDYCLPNWFGNDVDSVGFSTDQSAGTVATTGFPCSSPPWYPKTCGTTNDLPEPPRAMTAYSKDYPRRLCQQVIDDAMGTCISMGIPACASQRHIPEWPQKPVSPITLGFAQANSSNSVCRFCSPFSSQSSYRHSPENTVDDYVRYPF